MQEQELKAYEGVKKQGDFLLRSARFRLAVVATELPNFTVTIPFRIPVTTSEYLNRHRYKPQYFLGSNILEQKVQLYNQGRISNEISDSTIFRPK